MNTESFQRELSRVAARIDALLAAERLPEGVRPLSLRRAVCDYPSRGGKRLRPALLLWSCGVLGGDPAHAQHAALAVELYHNWTLVHDDIIDRDDLRRGRPACHVMLARSLHGRHPAAVRQHIGASLAMLAGDIQHAWAVDALARATADGVPEAVVGALVQRLCNWLTPALISGEALDVELSLRRSVTPAQIQQMTVLKTGALLRFTAEAGAQIALGTTDHTEARVATLGRFAEAAGVAFQLQDDLLGLFAEESTLGKPAGSDLREGKRTLLYVTALARTHGTQRAYLLSLLGAPRISPTQLERARRLVTASGAADCVRRRAAQLAAKARAELLSLPPNACRELLEQWLAYLLSRAS